MGLFDYITAAVSKLRQRTESKPKIRTRQNHASGFRVEQLEPRLLLSADLVPQADIGTAIVQPQLAATVLQLEPTNQSAVNQSDQAVDISQYTPNIVDFSVETADSSTAAEPNNSKLETQSASTNFSPTSDGQSSTNLSIAGVVNSSSVTEQLVETLRVANGPPSFPGMQLLNNDLSQVYGQVFYLDFDGASGLTYDGPVRVENVDVSPFRIPANFSVNTTDFIGSVLTFLNERFSSFGISFSTTQPQLSSGYSTIYIGGDGSAFSPYGSFLGLAEQVDVGNQDRSDDAFVFSDKIFQPGMSAADYSAALTEIIEHEALHLLGYSHADGQTTGLNAVAAFPPPAGGTITVNSAGDDDTSNDNKITLREAILIANGERSPGADEKAAGLIQGNPGLGKLDTIVFNLSGNTVITLGSKALPVITDPVKILGGSQPGFGSDDLPVPIVRIDATAVTAVAGKSAPSGLEIATNNSEVRNLSISGAPGFGIIINNIAPNTNVGGNIISGNWIGLDATGTQSAGNKQGGIILEDSADNTIIGNTISGNGGVGVFIADRSVHNTVIGNLIGTDFLGQSAVPNKGHGVILTGAVNFPSDNFIGGTGSTDFNLISGNESWGIEVFDATRTQIIGNRIGTNFAGDAALPNTQTGKFGNAGGVLIDGGAADTQITGNTVSGNQWHGVAVTGSATQGTVVASNLIGTDINGNLAIPNAGDGVFLGNNPFPAGSGSPFIPVIPLLKGVDVPGAPSNTRISGNTISANGRDGVHIEAGATNNFVLGNLIGTKSNGTGSLGNTGDGVAVIDSPDNIIGGRKDDSGNLIIAGNVISGNRGNGIHVLNLLPRPLLEPNGTRVVGNIIGLDQSGATEQGNVKSGVFLDKGASVNVIGGTTSDERNIISGNRLVGIWISGDRNTVQGNYIGTDKVGLNRKGNVSGGVFIEGDNNTIGGVQLDAFTLMGGNLISGNILGFGIEIANPSRGNIVKGNFIGTDKDGEGFLANNDGIIILNSQANTIGGETLTPGFSPGNLISGNARHGIFIAGSNSKENRVLGNVIGLDNIGRPDGNIGDGVHIDGGHNNTIGGASESVRNVISGNFQSGIAILNGSLNLVAGNFIGTDKTGALTSFGNHDGGVVIIETADNVIGGEVIGALNPRNIISGNGSSGVLISGQTATNNTLQGNYIGTDITGLIALPNTIDGVKITSLASGNTIGGIFPGDGNLISGNSEVGIRINDGAGKNKVQGNFIGGGAAPGALIENGHHGIFIEHSSGNIIGGESPFAANTISLNGETLKQKGHGVVVSSGTGNRITGNSIFGNAGRGIDLGDNSFTLNDAGGDSDIGANNLQDYPFVVGVQFLGADKIIQWNLDSTPLTLFTIQFFSNSSPDPSGFGEGKTYLRTKSLTVLTDITGTASFVQSFSSSDLFISATATDPEGNTSEFSMVDTDGDGLADAWEDAALSNFGNIDVNGDGIISGVIDFNEDGKPDLELPEARPDHKDLFIEVDAMTGMAPALDALAEVIAAFGRAPAGLVNNPDGTPGITLHIPPVDDTLPLLPFKFSFDQYFLYKSVFFGTNADRDARSLVYRYALYVADIDGPNILGVTQNSQFASEVGFMILGGINSGLAGTRFGQAANFMHELGHSLGLSHGGVFPDEINFKPNYRSVMNYLMTFPYPWTFEDQNLDTIQQPWEVDRNGDGWHFTDTTWRLDYSTKAFNTLNEADLDEAAGIGGDASKWVLYGPQFPFPRVVSESGPVDWSLGDADGDGDPTNDTGVAADLNTRGGKEPPSPAQILQGSEDWSHLKFYFLESSTFRGFDSNAAPDLGMSFDLFEELSAIGDGPGFFQFRKDELVSESDGTVTITVTRAGGTRGTVSVDFSTADGSARAGLDYVATSGTLTFAEGEFRKTFTIPILPDLTVEGTKTIQLKLSNPTGESSLNVENSTAVVNILDDDGVQFDAALRVVDEDAGSTTITVTRTDTQNRVSVDFHTEDLTATAGKDYTAVSGTLIFDAGVSSKTFTIPVLDDSLVEGFEGVRLVLSNPTAAALGRISEGIVMIRDVEHGVFQLSDAVYEVGENGGSATITVTRTNGTDGAVTVNFATSNGTATAGFDYAATSGALTFADGETVKTFTITVTNDSLAETTETVNLILSNPTGGSVLGNVKTGELRIADDESPSFAFSSLVFDVNENGSTATIQVVRLGVNDGAASIDFATTDGTARAGSDYMASAGTLKFARGESRKTFEVPVIDDKLGEGTKTLQLVLSNPSAGAQVGTPGSTTLRILDDETANAATFVVTNTNDSGAGSLRQAILDANARTGTDFITFNIPGSGVKTIQVLSALPAITSPVTIDGYSQPGTHVNTLSTGDNAVLLIQVNGVSIQAGNSIIRGLIIPSSVSILTGGGNLIAGNFIGTDATGMIGVGGFGGTIAIGSTTGGFSSNNMIGGTSPELRNVVFGDIGIFSSPTAADANHSRANSILGNYVGVTADGVTTLSSGDSQGFVRNGGSVTIDTGDHGILAPAGNTIGGIEPGAGNVIAFNDNGGVHVLSGYGNSIRGNSIDAAAPQSTTFVNNFRGLGISLFNANKVANLFTNDADDSDTGDELNISSPTSGVLIPGGNKAQNVPILSAAIAANGAITIQGRLDSAKNTTFQIDFYGNEHMDPTGFGEGKYYLGTASVTTDPTGHADFTAVFNFSTPNLRLITATATDTDHNTSEFSARVTVGEVLGNVYIVNTTADHDDGVADGADTTLREAILAANNHPGPDTIKFNIPGASVQTIVLSFALPPIMDEVTIDGFSQPGAKPNSLAIGYDAIQLIQIRPAPTIGTIPAALEIAGRHTTVRGLIINQSGLFIDGGGFNVIEGNLIGVDPAGNAGGGLLQITHSANNLIGGATPAARNLLQKVRFESGADGNVVTGNYIGARKDGLSNLPPNAAGSLSISNSSNNEIDGNVLFGDITIDGGPVNIGPLDFRAFSDADGNRLLRNFIGVGADGASHFFVGGRVILESNASNNVIGQPAAGNVIRGDGVFLFSNKDSITQLLLEPVGNSIRGNSIYQNSGLGIALGDAFNGDLYTFGVFVTPGNEVTRNDNNDVPIGPNHLQNYPVLSSAISATGGITIQGRLNSTPNSTFQIDFYANDQFDPTGFGEGRTYIGTRAVTTDATGHVNFTATLPFAITGQRFITATATSPTDDTSEFSARITIGDVLGNVYVVNTIDDHDDGVADASDTTLREAIHAANNHPGHDTILFNIPGGGVKTIVLKSDLPPVTDSVTLDGYSQPGSSPNTLADGDDAVLLIEITGSSGNSGIAGLDIRAGDTTVRGFVFNRFGQIFIAENGGNVIEGNFLGTDPTGSVAVGGASIEIFASSNNLIGGTTPAARNLISGASGFIVIHGGAGPTSIPNQAAFYLASGNVVQGNYIGTDRDGTKALDTGNVVSIFGASNNLIGGTTAGARNVIVGGVGLGSSLVGGLATVGFQLGSPDPAANNILQGNYIGTDRTGKVGLGGSGVGVGGVGNVVGGTAPGAGNLISGSGLGAPGIGIEGVGHIVQGNRIGTDVDGTFSVANGGDGLVISGSGHLISGNVISGNAGNGIEFFDSLFLGIHHAATGNRIEANFIGTLADGITPLPNLGDGILVTPATNLAGNNLVFAGFGATDNTIGGTAAGAGNVIAFNGGNGVNLNDGTIGTAATRIAILGNSIYSNGKLGIDLKGNGVTTNDTGDTDSGDNFLQNFPVLTSVTNNGASVTIQGTLNSAPSATYRLEFFDNVAFDSSNFGEGKRFIGSTNVTTDASGNAGFATTFQVALPSTDVITATATDAIGNTSEFSGRPVNGSAGATANLSVIKTDSPNPVLTGQLLTYTITVTNNGPDTATNVTLIDTLPTGVKFQSATAAQGQFASIGTTSVFGNLGSIAGGFAVTVQVKVVPATAGSFTNSVKVAADQYDTDTTNNSATAVTLVNPGADLVLTKTANVTGSVGLGGTVEFVITVTNNGPVAASSVNVTDVLPAGLTFDSFGSGTTGTKSGSTLTWSLGTLASGTTSTVRFFAVANTLGSVSNSAQLTSTTADPNTANNASSASITVIPGADLSVTSTVSQPVATLGGTLTYTLTVRNNGPSDTQSVVLADTLPTDASFVSASSSQGNVTTAGGTVTFELGNMLTGAQATATVVIIPTVASKVLVNSANVTSSVFDAHTLDNQTSIATLVPPAVLFGVAELGAKSSTLYAIDPTSGATAPIGPIGFNRISGMDFDPRTGILYAAGTLTGTVRDSILITIDTTTGVGTAVGPTLQRAEPSDLSFRDSDDKLFAYLGRSGNLATLDLVSGKATVIGFSNSDAGNALAFSPTGTLYHSYDDIMDTLDTSTGSVTASSHLIYSAPADSSARLNALDFDSKTGVLFASLNAGFFTASENYLATVNVVTGVVTIIGRTVDGLDAIAFVPVQEPLNQVPELAAIGDQTVSEGASRVVAISATDADGDSLTLVAFNLPPFASFTDNGNGTGTLRVNPGFNDAGIYAGVKITVSDGSDSDDETFTITVNNTNRPPVAANDGYATNEDTTRNVAAAQGVLFNDTDADGDTLAAVLIANVTHGSLSLNANGSFTYTPTANYNGSDSFTYKANDGQALNNLSNIATVNLTINSVNDAPVANDDSATSDEDTPKLINVLNNDSDIDGTIDPTTVIIAFSASHGTLSVNVTTGAVTYSPAANYFGADSFRYTVKDNGGLASNIALVSITVNSVNDAPAAVDDGYSTNEDTPLIVNAIGVLGNDSDVDSVNLNAILIGTPTHGALTLNSNGGFTYNPAANYFGPDSYTYRASDGQALSDLATVTIEVIPSNHAPVAKDDSATTDEDQPKIIEVLVNDSDADHDALTVNAFSQPINGQVIGNANGTLTYTPNANFYGVDAFTYTVDDGHGGSSTATVTVNVRSVNDTPVITAMDGTAVIDEGQVVTLRGTFSDADVGDVLSLTVNWGDGVVEVLSLNDAKSFTLTHKYLDDNPTATPSDNYQVKVKVTDNNGGTAEGAFTVTVNNVAPIASLTGASSGVRGQQLSFAGAIADVGILDTHQISFDFGDGTVTGFHSSTDADALAPTHVYATAGTYTVRLTVRDDDGGVSTATKQVVIKAVDLQVDPCDSSKTALVVGGTNGNDTIRFVPQGNNGEIKVLINGVSQGIFKPTERIIAYGLGGDDDIEVAGNINLTAILYGNDGNDRLKGGAGSSMLLGGDGDDYLIGGSGRSILIGGRGADRLVGNGDDDILIGGTTKYDNAHTALCEILEGWNRCDLNYSKRVVLLSTGVYALNSSTVFDDGVQNQLTGAAGDDWFFAGVKDKLTDRKNFEIVALI